MDVLKSLDFENGIAPKHIILEYVQILNPNINEVFKFLTNRGYSAYTIEMEPLLQPPVEHLIDSNMYFVKKND